ncbi:DNA-binding transcriptional regulator, AcrR family [Evansella caseinilytica]|uniref:DNA-binding transcriptional regulator, AcrR family n=1 Tax=Evansella caseinilytica TaxID=1503961 RepID=A0A1H3SK19_9BACI|nr:TetR/AcrR family transcriptional regulator [Evansella caseinilytica]SDZ38322.1 DNA-binding transcriptional regulator, AcrR family [Evansella caseinilytica]
MDRRIKKSQKAIMNALIHLMAEKDFEHITINEIAEHADVNRGTVYSHYTDKYDLLDKCIEAQLQQLIKSCLPMDETETNLSMDSLLRTFQQMEKDIFIYRTLLTNKGVPSFRNHLQEMMKKEIREQINEYSMDDTSKEIIVQFLSSAIVGVIEWWLMQQTVPCSAKKLSAMLRQLLRLHSEGASLLLEGASDEFAEDKGEGF